MAIKALGAKRFAQSAHTRLLAVVLVAVAGAAHAEWVTVAKDREREVQLDLQTVIPAEAGVKVAWGRVLLAPDELTGGWFLLANGRKPNTAFPQRALV